MARDHERDEWAADALNDRDDQAAWEAMRNLDLGLEPGGVSTDEMQARWAADRAEVMADCQTGEEWRREALLAVADKAAVLQTPREDAA